MAVPPPDLRGVERNIPPPDYWRQFFAQEASPPTPVPKIAERLRFGGAEELLLGMVPEKIRTQEGPWYQVLGRDRELLFELRHDAPATQKARSRFLWWAGVAGDTVEPAGNGSPHERGAAVMAASRPGGPTEAFVGYFALYHRDTREFCASRYDCLFWADGHGRTELFVPSIEGPSGPAWSARPDGYLPSGEFVERSFVDVRTGESRYTDARGTLIANFAGRRYALDVGGREFRALVRRGPGELAHPLFHLLADAYRAAVQRRRKAPPLPQGASVQR